MRTTGAEPWTNADYTPMVYDCKLQAYNRSKQSDPFGGLRLEDRDRSRDV